MFETIKHCVPRRKTLTRTATAERWENTIYHQTFIHVCVKNILFFHELLKLNIERTIHFDELRLNTYISMNYD